MNNWKTIWDKRTLVGGIDLEALIKLNGFDTGAGKIAINDWRFYALNIIEKLGIKAGDSVFEVGCGSGALLYALQEKVRIQVGGVDYADGMIAVAKRAIPDGEFQVMEAKDFSISQKYDFVISNGLFHYFDSEYAVEVLRRMVAKAKVMVAVMEIPDMATREESELFRRGILGVEEYEKKYKGLEHNYYKRDWFHQQADYYGLPCELFNGFVPNYSQNQFRFGCIIHK